MPGYHFTRIEKKWREYWEVNHTFRTPDFAPGKPKLYILDMFPYPSGAGLHVGHPEGYTATDILCRYKRMRGFNVLHPMGWDAFGLPAEQYAIQTGTHPRETTQKNIATFKRQIQSLGFSYDWEREVDTTDPAYYKWTQWIFLKIFDTWYDPNLVWVDQRGGEHKGKGRPISELPIPSGVDPELYRDSKRLAYRAELPVNWCPVLGTVLANEEVIDGKSERGGHPVVRMPLKQWMLRITAYAERLIDDLDGLDWSRAIKEMQRNWVGRSEGAFVDFGFDDPGTHHMLKVETRTPVWSETAPLDVIRVFTTRPDTLFGATYMVLAPEHPIVNRITTREHREAVAAYRAASASKSDMDRTDLAKTKTGVFTGGYATNPVNGKEVPVWVADYVLMGYGTGAIMAVPGHDDRDFEFAKVYDLPIVRVVASSLEDAKKPLEAAEHDAGIAVNSRNADVSLNGMGTDEAKTLITGYLESIGMGKKTINYKLRDWLFSRQRYWGEPFPILLGEGETVCAVPIEELPVLLPEVEDYLPSGRPEPPLGKATEWVNYSDAYRRETNTMPQWAGSCWYYLRYIDPKNAEEPWSSELEHYWLPVDLYVGGAEHAVLHLLYSRFWHKVMFDYGLVHTPEPFQKLVNQGMILGEMEFNFFEDDNGNPVSPDDVQEHVSPDGGTSAWIAKDNRTVIKNQAVESEVIKRGDSFYLKDHSEIRVIARAHKMSKSRGNVISPDQVVEDYGADSLRLYEMFMGPLEAVKPWSMKGVEGVYRFLGRAWRMIVDHEGEDVRLDPKVQDVEMTREQASIVARTVAGVTDDLDGMRFNTAISKLMEFTNKFTGMDVRPKAAMEAFVLLLAPMAPHVAEEMWEVLGHGETLAFHPWPVVGPPAQPVPNIKHIQMSGSLTVSGSADVQGIRFDSSLLKDETIEVPVQINGKVRGRIVIASDSDDATLEAAARSDEKVAALLEGKTVRKVIVAQGKLVNFVVS